MFVSIERQCHYFLSVNYPFLNNSTYSAICCNGSELKQITHMLHDFQHRIRGHQPRVYENCIFDHSADAWIKTNTIQSMGFLSRRTIREPLIIRMSVLYKAIKTSTGQSITSTLQFFPIVRFHNHSFAASLHKNFLTLWLMSVQHTQPKTSIKYAFYSHHYLHHQMPLLIQNRAAFNIINERTIKQNPYPV